MSDQIYLSESIVRSPVIRHGRLGFLANCFKYSCRYLIGFGFWLAAMVVGYLALILVIWGLGFGANQQQQANPAGNPWFLLLLFPLVLAMGFFAKFLETKTWRFRRREVFVHSLTGESKRIALHNIDSITIEVCDGYEIWRLKTCDTGDLEMAVFFSDNHNQLMKTSLLGEDSNYEMAKKISVVG